MNLLGYSESLKELLLAFCSNGEPLVIAEQRPEESTDNNTIRADFIRDVISHKDYYHGVSIEGVWITGILDLRKSKSISYLEFKYCYFDESVILSNIEVANNVIFNGCFIKNKLLANSIKCQGYFFIKNSVITKEINLSYATINERLEFLEDYRTKSIENFQLEFLKDSEFIFCDFIFDHLLVNGDVIIKTFLAKSILLSFSHIGGNLLIEEGFFYEEDYKFEAEGISVKGGFFLKKLTGIDGAEIFTLGNSNVMNLVDDIESYPNGKTVLAGFTYTNFAGEGTLTDAENRINWLKKQIPEHLNNEKEFKPQPWKQLQKVLREMGHFEDARQIGIAFEKQRRKAYLIGQNDCYNPFKWIYKTVCRAFHLLFGLLIGYGYRPLRLFFIMLFVWLLCGVFYWCAAVNFNNGNGIFAPTNPLIFQNPDYAVCVPDSCEAKIEKIKDIRQKRKLSKPSTKIFQWEEYYDEYKSCMSDDIEKAKKILDRKTIKSAGNWYLCEKLNAEYTGFSPFAYSLDLILPLVDLQQEHDWSVMVPTPTKSSAFLTCSEAWEYFTRFIIWCEILFGWFASLLLVAVLSGLTKQQDD